MLEQTAESVAVMRTVVIFMSLVVFFGALLEPLKAWRAHGRVAWPVIRDSLPAACWSILFLVLAILGHPVLALAVSAVALFWLGLRLARLQMDPRGNFYLALGFGASSAVLAPGQGRTAAAAAVLCVIGALVVFLKGIVALERQRPAGGPG